ncbi:MAG: tetratricopeptide repeat protein, partial [Cyanothece sp. SIO2G6]|nr:tetratricopeptide repeat protein [Cyanothece sp. SIO2G6]
MRSVTVRLATAVLLALGAIAIPDHQMALAQFLTAEATTEQEPATNEDARAEPSTLTIEGSLSEASEVLNDGTYFNAHTFEAEAGDFVTITLSSDEFDTYVLLRDAEGNTIAQNDDSDGTHSQIQMVLSTAGTYTIWANSYEAAATGVYTLVIQRQDLAEIEALEQRLGEVRQAGDATAEIETLEAIAQLYRQRGQHNEALGYLQQVVPIVEEMQSRSQATDDEVAELAAMMRLGEAYKAVGDALDDVGQFEEAIATFQQGLEVAEEALDLAEDLDHHDNVFEIRRNEFDIYFSLALTYSSYSNLFRDDSHFEEAKSLAKESINSAKLALYITEKILAFAQENDNKNWIDGVNKNYLPFINSRIMTLYHSMANVYSSEAAYLLDQGLLQENLEVEQASLKIEQEALPFAMASGDLEQERTAFFFIVNSYDAISTAYRWLEKYSESIEHAEYGLNLARQHLFTFSEFSILNGLPAIYQGLGEEYYESGDYEQALVALNQGLIYAQELIDLDASSEFLDKENNFGRSNFEGRFDWEKLALQSQWNIYVNMDDIYEAQGNYEEVLATRQQTLRAAQDLGDLSTQVASLISLFEFHYSANQYPEALEVVQQALEIAEETNYSATLSSVLLFRGSIFSTLGRYSEAIADYEKGLELIKGQDTLHIENIFLNNLAVVYDAQGDYENALENLNEILRREREIRGYLQQENIPEFVENFCLINVYTEPDQSESNGLQSTLLDRVTEEQLQKCLESTWDNESTTLNSLGAISSDQGRYSKALELYEQSLKISRRINDQRNEIYVLNNIGNLYIAKGRYEDSLEILQEALSIQDSIPDRESVVPVLTNKSTLYTNQGLYDEAIRTLQEALNITDELELLPKQALLLNQLGFVYFLRGDYKQAETYYQQALDLSKDLGIVTDKAQLLSNLGQLSFSLGKYAQAIEYETQALDIHQSIGNLDEQPAILNNMGRYHRAQANYVAALDAHQQALNIATDIGAQVNQAYSLEAMGSTYYALGDDEQALDSLRQALTRFRAIGHPEGEASTLNTMGTVYTRQGKRDRALDTQQQALAIYQRMGHLAGESRSWQHIGFIHEQSGDYTAAQTAFDQALDLQDQMGARGLQGTSLNGLGLAYHGQGEPDRALDRLQQALVLYRASGDPAGEGKALGDMGNILAEQGQVELAIAFLKRSINITEAIRGELQSLPRELQESYAETVSDRYRLLANLLLQQDRVLEAQEVLDLLKLQELDDFNLRTRGNSQTAQGLDLWEAEQAILTLFDQHLVDHPDGDFDEFLSDDNLQQQVEQLRRNAQGQNLNPAQLEKLQDNLQQLGNAALLYPLVLDDRLELILVTTAGISRHTVAVDRPQLNRAILDFRADITNRRSNPIPNARRLYTWLVDPIAADLEAAGADTILYAADGQLRYIPLAALHDGNQWLTQRYTINHITAASLTDFSRGENRDLQILAGAFSDVGKTHSFTIGDKQFHFNGLPFAGMEVEAIATEIPDTQAYFDQDFSRANVEPQMGDYSIVHFATHAEFVPGLPHESFILFGNGDRVSLRDISNWQLPNTDLVVLSACRTAVSGELGGGEEILGFGYQVQRTGARAAIASLWYVDDSGTQSLMTTFYTALQNGYSETEALRQAQIALITNNFTSV